MKNFILAILILLLILGKQYTDYVKNVERQSIVSLANITIQGSWYDQHAYERFSEKTHLPFDTYLAKLLIQKVKHLSPVPCKIDPKQNASIYFFAVATSSTIASIISPYSILINQDGQVEVGGTCYDDPDAKIARDEYFSIPLPH